MLSKGSAKQNFGAVCWLCWRAGKLNSCPSFRKFLGQAQPLGDAYTPRPRIQSWRSHSVCHLGPPRLPNDQGWVLQGWAQKAAGRLCSWLALWSCQVLKPGSNSLDGSGSASTMMWLQRCQLKLIKIHVVLYDVVIKRAQFPNGVRVFAGFKVEFFPGLNLCAYSRMIGNLCRELSLPRSSHTALIRPLPSTQNCSKTHTGASPTEITRQWEKGDKLCDRLVSRKRVVNSGTLLMYVYTGAPTCLFLSINTLIALKQSTCHSCAIVH